MRSSKGRKDAPHIGEGAGKQERVSTGSTKTNISDGEDDPPPPIRTRLGAVQRLVQSFKKHMRNMGKSKFNELLSDTSVEMGMCGRMAISFK